MTNREELPVSGYLVDRIFTTQQSYEIRRPEGAVSDGSFLFGWDWEFRAERLFDVRLELGLDPTEQRWEKVRLTIIGRFAQRDDNPAVPLLEFVRLQAPAILMPYAREVLTNLTSRGFYGAYFLPPVNIVRLMAKRDTSQATGAKQLERGQFMLTATPSKTRAIAKTSREQPSTSVERKSSSKHARGERSSRKEPPN